MAEELSEQTRRLVEHNRRLYEELKRERLKSDCILEQALHWKEMADGQSEVHTHLRRRLAQLSKDFETLVDEKGVEALLQELTTARAQAALQIRSRKGLYPVVRDAIMQRAALKRRVEALEAQVIELGGTVEAEEAEGD